MHVRVLELVEDVVCVCVCVCVWCARRFAWYVLVRTLASGLCRVVKVCVVVTASAHVCKSTGVASVYEYA